MKGLTECDRFKQTVCMENDCLGWPSGSVFRKGSGGGGNNTAVVVVVAEEVVVA